MNFSFYDISLNIQNGGAHSTNVEIFNCLWMKLICGLCYYVGINISWTHHFYFVLIYFSFFFFSFGYISESWLDIVVLSGSPLLSFRHQSERCFLLGIYLTLRKQAYSNVKKISPPKTENFQIKKLWYFSYFCSKHRLWVLVRTTSASSSNEYPHSMFLNKNKKNNVYPCKPQF